jgi:carbonic anhydrase/acetyltransferase-like protein (isoleucine patch superfamily)
MRRTILYGDEGRSEIGETVVVEGNVSILHEVTLGGTGKESGDRHPKVKKSMMIGAGAKILGNVVIGEGAKVGAGSVVLDDVPPHYTVVGVPAQIVGKTEVPEPSLDMNQRVLSLPEKKALQRVRLETCCGWFPYKCLVFAEFHPDDRHRAFQAMHWR